MGLIERLTKQLGILAGEDIRWENPHLQRAMVPIRIPHAARAYREHSNEENARKVVQGLEQFERFYQE